MVEGTQAAFFKIREISHGHIIYSFDLPRTQQALDPVPQPPNSVPMAVLARYHSRPFLPAQYPGLADSITQACVRARPSTSSPSTLPGPSSSVLVVVCLLLVVVLLAALLIPTLPPFSSRFQLRAWPFLLHEL